MQGSDVPGSDVPALVCSLQHFLCSDCSLPTASIDIKLRYDKADVATKTRAVSNEKRAFAHFWKRIANFS
jgi:hypothetical protein